MLLTVVSSIHSWVHSEDEEHVLHEYEAHSHESNNHLPNEQMLLAQKNAEFDIEVSLHSNIEITIQSKL